VHFRVQSGDAPSRITRAMDAPVAVAGSTDAERSPSAPIA
jgi:hypothetical protein